MHKVVVTKKLSRSMQYKGDNSNGGKYNKEYINSGTIQCFSKLTCPVAMLENECDIAVFRNP